MKINVSQYLSLTFFTRRLYRDQSELDNTVNIFHVYKTASTLQQITSACTTGTCTTGTVMPGF